MFYDISSAIVVVSLIVCLYVVLLINERKVEEDRFSIKWRPPTKVRGPCIKIYCNGDSLAD